jgi:hypothetical protein
VPFGLFVGYTAYVFHNIPSLVTLLSHYAADRNQVNHEHTKVRTGLLHIYHSNSLEDILISCGLKHLDSEYLRPAAAITLILLALAYTFYSGSKSSGKRDDSRRTREHKVWTESEYPSGMRIDEVFKRKKWHTEEQ